MAISVPASRHLGIAWIALCAAFAVHVADEALTGFLSVYNPTVIGLRQRYNWFPMPVFDFWGWLTGLVIAIAALLALSPFAFRGAAWLRPLAYVFAVIMLVNAAGHTLGTIFGRTLPSITFERPMPGFYSSPLLLVASVYMLRALGRTGSQAE
ncbi:MAG: hypothetical protein ACRD2Q_04295 [Terriglobales bacterium]